MIKGSIQEGDIATLYAPNIGAPQYASQMLTSMKGEINSSTKIVGDLNIPLTPMDRSTKQKISKETKTSNDAMNQWDLINSYRTFNTKTMNFPFSSSVHETFSRTVHILGNKSNFRKFKKAEIISSIFSNHNAIKLEFFKKSIKNTNTWRLNSVLLNNREITEEIKEEIQNKKIYRNKWQQKHSDSKPIIQSKSSSKRKNYSNSTSF